MGSGEGAAASRCGGGRRGAGIAGQEGGGDQDGGDRRGSRGGAPIGRGFQRKGAGLGRTRTLDTM
jgi:hypothetical protein